MKTRIIVLFVMLFCFSLSAQNQFQKRFGDFVFGQNEQAVGICQFPNGDYMVAATGYAIGDGKIILHKMGALGNEIWTNTYESAGKSYTAHDMVKTSDGGAVIVGNVTDLVTNDRDVLLLKVDANGQLMWTRSYGGNDSEYGDCISETSDLGFIIGGYTRSFGVFSSDVYLVKTFADGTLEWSKTYGSTGNEGANDVIQTSDGGYALTGDGFITPAGFGVAPITLLKTDASGNELFTKSYRINASSVGGGFELAETNDGGLAIIGFDRVSGIPSLDSDIFFVKTDAQGNLNWGAVYGGASEDNGVSFVQHPDDTYTLLAMSSSFNSGDRNPYLLKINANGTPLWAKTYDYRMPNSNFDLDITNDNGYIFSGSVLIGSQNADMLAIKTDGNGISNGCEDVAGIPVVFPDITTDSISVATVSPNEQDSLTSVLGQLVMEDTFSCQGGLPCSPSCQTNTVSINTGFDHLNGVPYNQGDFDAFWTLVASPDPTIGVRPAAVINPHPSWHNQTNTRWISAYPQTGFNGGCTQAACEPYVFQYCFCVCEDSTAVTIDLDVLVDNIVDINLTDGSGNLIQNLLSITTVNTSTFTNPPAHSVNTLTLNSGTYCLQAELKNDGSTAMGLNIEGTITGAGLLSELCCNPNGSITGLKFNDENCNGVQDPGEGNLSGWQIDICDHTGQVIGSAITDNFGYYTFSDLSPGAYTLKEVNQPGYVQTFPPNNIHTVNLGAGQVVGSLDFGNVEEAVCNPSCCSADEEEFCAKVDEILAGIAIEPCYKLLIEPYSLEDCHRVTYQLSDGTVFGPFIGNEPVCHYFPGPDEYEVCITVEEVLPDGEICFEKTICHVVQVPECACDPSVIDMTANQFALDGLCCFSFDLANNHSNPITRLVLDIQNTGVVFEASRIQVNHPDLNWNLTAPDQLEIFANVNFIGFPQGASQDLFHFCFQNAPPSSQVTLDYQWYATQPNDGTALLCESSLDLLCEELPCDTLPQSNTFSTIISSPANGSNPDGFNEFGRGGVQEPSTGNYYLLGQSYAPSGFPATPNIQISTLDILGNETATDLCDNGIEEEEKHREHPQSMTEVIFNGNPALAVTGHVGNDFFGDDLFIKITDLNGVTAFERHFYNTPIHEEGEVGAKIIQASNGDIVAVGTSRPGPLVNAELVMICMSNSGIVHFAKHFDFGMQIVVHSVTEVSGWSSSGDAIYAITGSMDGEVFVVLIDNSGLIFRPPHIFNLGDGNDDSIGHEIIQDSNGDLVIAGQFASNDNMGVLQWNQPFLLKVSEGPGSLQADWAYRYDVLGSGNETAWSLVENHQGNYVLAGRSNFSIGSQPSVGVVGEAFMVEVDQNGASVNWGNKYRDQAFTGSMFEDITLAQDGGYLSTGSIWKNKLVIVNPPVFDVVSFYDLYAVKTDAQGVVSDCDCYEPVPIDPYPVESPVQLVNLQGVGDLGADDFPYECVQLEVEEQFCEQFQPMDTIGLECGMAVVTCFGGFQNSNSPYHPMNNTLSSTGDVIAIVDVRNNNNAPNGRNWHTAPRTYLPMGTAQDLGQVFGVALDRFNNIYTTATTIYGNFPSGDVNAFGPAGPGGVYKIDAITGAISSITIPNAGSGLGNICYDESFEKLYVTNFYDGAIYTIDVASGANFILLGTPYNPILNGILSSGQPDFVGLGERIWGIDSYNGKLYFSVWNDDRGRPNNGFQNQIWSVMLNGTGGIISGSETLEFNIPVYSTPAINNTPATIEIFSSPISDIAISEAGKILMAERSLPWDYGTLHNTNFNINNIQTQTVGYYAHLSRVLEYNPLTNTTTTLFVGNTTGAPAPNLPHTRYHANSSGGIDYGYAGFDSGHEPVGCDSIIWSTGDALRINGIDPLRPECLNTVIDPLFLTTPDCNVLPSNVGLLNGLNDRVYGITGIPANGNSDNSGSSDYVKTSSIYVDLDDIFISNAIKTNYGDIEILKCIDCPPHTSTCDSLSASYFETPDTTDFCCFKAELENQMPELVTGVRLTPISPAGLTFGDIVNCDNSQWSFLSAGPQSIEIVSNTGNISPGCPLRYFPTGTLQPVQFCLRNYGSSPQQVLVEWMACDSTVCTDTLTFECSRCVDITNDTLACIGGEYKYIFDIQNVWDQEVCEINLKLPPGVSASPASITFNPCLQPGETAQGEMFSIDGIEEGDLLKMVVEACADTFFLGESLNCCLSDSICIEVPACCDTCASIEYMVSDAVFNDDTCCFSLDVRHCVDSFFTGVKLSSLTNGVFFSDVFSGTDWYMQSPGIPNTMTTWHPLPPPPNTVYIEPNQWHQGKINFCLGGYNFPNQVPQDIQIDWLAGSQGTVACSDTLSFQCQPPPADTCVRVVQDSFVCLPDGAYEMYLRIENASNFTAEQLKIGNLHSKLPGVNPITPFPVCEPVNLPPGSSTWVGPIVFDNVPPGDSICFQVGLKDTIVMDDYLIRCCISDTICIAVPDCDSCCESFDAFCERVDAGFSWTVDDECTLTVTPNGLDSCDWVFRWTWGDLTFTDGPWVNNTPVSHTYTQGGQYEVCMDPIFEINEAGEVCWEKIKCDTITIACEGCDDLNWSGVDFNCELIANDTCEVPMVQVSEVISGTLTPDWVSYDFDCDGTADVISPPSPVTHDYGAPGTYLVCIQAFELVGTDTCVEFFEKAIEIPVVDTCGTFVVALEGEVFTISISNDSMVTFTPPANLLSTDFYDLDIDSDGGNGFEYEGIPGNEATTHTYDEVVDSNIPIGVRMYREVCGIECEVFITDVVSSSSEVFDKGSLKIYPNPTSGNVTVEMKPSLPPGLAIEVFDLNGRKRSKELIRLSSERVRLDLNGLPQGIYFLKMSTPEAVHFERIILQ